MDTTGVLPWTPVGNWPTPSRANRRRPAARPSSGLTTEDIHNVGRARKPVRNVDKRRRRTIDREFFTKVADTYREHFEDRPLKAIELAYGAAPRTAAWYVELCSSDEYGLLPKLQAREEKGVRKDQLEPIRSSSRSATICA
jgi:hypothetical protein